MKRAALAAAALFVAVPADAQAGRGGAPQPAGAAVERWSALVGEAAGRFGLPASWLRQVMRAESGGRTQWNGRPIVSKAGAMGLMQVMPATWAEMRRIHRLGDDPHDPRDNILAGAAYLRAMYDRFGYPGLFAAYNAGPARYAEHLRTGRRLPAETRSYAAMVASRTGAAPVAHALRSPKLFASRKSGSVKRGQSAASSPLFVPLQGAAAFR